MDKIQLLEKIKSKSYSHEQLMSWIGCLPGSSSSRKPKFNKIGDVFMHPVFQHPYILLEKNDDIWVCCLMTTEVKFPDILEKCRSRFFEGYITKSLFTASEIKGSFLNNYDNSRHLKKVLIKLRQILNGK